MASTSLMFSSPGMPKTCVTPSFSRHSTIRAAVLRGWVRGEGAVVRGEDSVTPSNLDSSD